MTPPADAALAAKVRQMESVLLHLDSQGGLGHDKHALIKKALGVPYPEHCFHAKECMGRSSCPRDPTCID